MEIIKKISICVGLKDRTNYLIKYLINSMNKCKSNDMLELSVFDCGSDDIEDLKSTIMMYWKGELAFKQQQISFSRSFTFNNAVKNSKYDYVFLCDSDMFLPEDFVEQFFKNVSKEKTWFPICFSLLKNRPFEVNENNGWWREFGFGMVGIFKDNFIKTGMLNECFTSWGGEDNDLYDKVGTIKIREKCFGLFHCWHCSLYNMRTTPEKFRHLVTRLDIERPHYVLAITTFNRLEYLKRCIETWDKTKDEYAEWTLIVADDGSTDDTILYLENLNLLFRKVIIKNNRNGIHHQVNKIIKYLSNKKFNVCFKCDDDIEFLKKGWDNAYFLAIEKHKFDHLVFHDEKWIGGKYKGFQHKIYKDDLISRVDAMNTQGGFYTITPNIIKTVGYFDLNKFGLCGLGHIDYTLRCCRANFNKEKNVYDLKNSNNYLKYFVIDYHEAPNEFRHVENTPEILKAKFQALNDQKRVFIGFNELKRRLMKQNNKIIYLLPSSKISGGVAVIVKHANLLLKKGYHVFLLSVNEKEKGWIQWIDNVVPIFSLKTIGRHMIEDVDILVMTYWETVKYAKNISAKRKVYFVQSDERKFYSDKQKIKEVNNTYSLQFEYMTEAKWIQKWLKEEFNFSSYYVPNGIDLSLFYKIPQNENRKRLRVLLEGAISIPFKGVADAHKAVRNLDCEIWIVSNDGVPPKDWRCDRFFKSVPMSKMKEIYSSCDILLKMSKVEGFFGPPMEAMACGCAVVISKCPGYDEYIEHDKNAIVVEKGDIAGASNAVKLLLSNVVLRNKLIKNGFETVKNWSWDKTLESLENVMGKKNINKKIIFNSEKENVCEIIIVVHNALSYIQRCIESIEKYTNFPYKITIVDNNSNYETQSFLKNLQNIKLIVNEKNCGFGYANNKAIRETNSKYVCFLNSDTIVTKNWLTKLVNSLEKNNAGIVGPVSNFVSSEIQQVKFDYQHNVNSNDDLFIQDFSDKITRDFSLKVVETNRLVGFCMVTKKEILDKSGIFDERYDFNFEDDDLGLRVIEQGYKLYCSLETFIYHFGGQTFKDRFNNITHNETLEKSKKLYLQKWYDSGRIKQLYSEHKKFKIIYILASNAPSGGVKVVFEQANMLKDRGHNVLIYCSKNELEHWFNVHAPVYYFSDFSDIPDSDIAIGTYFSTLPILQKVKSKLKMHLCQGYEVSLYENDAIYTTLVSTIKSDYRRIKEKIVVSKWLKEIIDKEFSVDSYHVKNGLDKHVFSFVRHAKNKIPRILIVGNINLEFKGVRIGLQAVLKFASYRKVVIVRMASEKTKVDDKYEFYDMSKMSQFDIAKVYSLCDVTISVPHKVEGFSLPPLESMASGTPVITTDCGGVNDYAINNNNAIIVPPKNQIAIEHALKIILSNEILYYRLVDNGISTANEFLWYKSIDKLESILDMLYKKQIDSEKEQLSVCMIVKNEEDCLKKCLESIKNIASEIIIVDTGSSDNTIKIAKFFGAKIFHFNWNDDFSAARNFSLEKATQHWVLVLDADEIISSKDIDKLKTVLRDKDAAYVFTTRNYINVRDAEGLNVCSGEYLEEEKGFIGWCRSDKVRLFPLNKNIKFLGDIHELVEDSIKQTCLEIKSIDVPIHHYSRLNKEKSDKYLKLSKKKLDTCKDDPKALYELATQYMALNNNDEALVVWRKLLEREKNNYDVLAHLGTTYNLLQDYKQAEKYFLESINIEHNDYAFRHLGICYAKQEKYEDAYFSFKKIVYTTEDLKTMADFSFCCSMLKKYDEGIIVLEKCLKINRKETISWGLLETLYNEKGVELAHKNKFLKAICMFKLALSINSHFDAAKTNLTMVNNLISTG
ncbi:MAG: glycosyltransferase [Candidatus Nanoarchaeia archaeon]|nr:glycosyltransferase [Candidatus Nanoarchaeia archaeon]